MERKKQHTCGFGKGRLENNSAFLFSSARALSTSFASCAESAWECVGLWAADRGRGVLPEEILFKNTMRHYHLLNKVLNPFNFIFYKLFQGFQCTIVTLYLDLKIHLFRD